ncbi:RecQ family ATP-dependent DNA helicase [Actinocrinis sp.]|uniref:RecQ family ATP-dependent DNA helicase n=1 Tax=Actinocrinis sp. TaxID=1920516 RepID=UPI002C32F19D|nr:DEAD/DEAH box helicase [Actinocrinis sp.]HXR69253.1 DEAD/DEAH box helicase [Actinocrinis sp.]
MIDQTGSTSPRDAAAKTAVIAPDRAALRAEAESVLRALAGPQAQLREDQWQAIEALVADRRRCLVVQRTGWGKSAVYFAATALLRARGAGPTVIVSPLLALMRNQIAAAERAGLHAATINSANLTEWSAVEERIRLGEVDLLLISPERLNNPVFRDNVLEKLAAETGLLVVDEAHCVSDWGHDFRPDYRRLRTLIGQLPAGLPVLATTATANARVTADVAEQLGTGLDSAAAAAAAAKANPAASRPDTAPLILRGPLDRASLRLSVIRPGANIPGMTAGGANAPAAAHRLAWLADHLAELPGSGIIYTLTVAAAEETALFLQEHGHTAAAYTGRTDDAQRREAEDDLLGNRIKALVATSALGMGFDKPDLGFVVHLGAPSSPIAYYQQVGRAGRGVERAEAILLPGHEDQAIWRYFDSLAFPPRAVVEQVLAVLGQSPKPLSTMAIEPQVELRRSRLELLLKVLDADGAVRRVSGGWTATGVPWSYDEERYARIAAAREKEQRAMIDYAATGDCRMEFLRRQLDDPYAERCGRCDNCTGSRLSAETSTAAVEAADVHSHRVGVPIEPRRQWPSGMPSVGVDLRGRIPEEEQHTTGRAVARLTDLGWGSALRDLFELSAADRPISDSLVAAVVDVLREWSAQGDPARRWSGAGRPVGVVSIESRRRPRLIGSLAARVAEIGRLPLLGAVDRVADGPPSGGANSAWRLRSVHAAFAISAELADRLRENPGPVLLVDDLVDSGWTLTVTARLLRQAGATAVLPLALATAG